MADEARRVVITGMGVCCPLGRTYEELWQNLLAGKSSVRDVSADRPYLKDYKVRIGSIFPDFKINPNIPIDAQELRRIDRFTQFSIDAAYQAVNDSGFLDYHPDETRERTGIVIGVGFGGISEIERQAEKYLTKGIDRVNAFLIPMVIPDSTTGNIAKLFGFHATECFTVNSACSSGASAIAEAYRLIKLDDADIMIAGGAEEAGSALSTASFGRLRVLSTRNDSPEEASRPFDIDRDGFVMGEGAGIVVLEELEHAKKRNARIYAELLGYGITQDAFHMTAPRDDCKYTAKAMKHALDKARLNPEQIDYINAHGTSTPLNDALETRAIRMVYGNHADGIDINSTKSMTGHTFGAAGALEFIVTVKTIQTGVIHPTKNLVNRDPQCDLRYTNQVIERKVKYAVSNSFGFFGHNAVLPSGEFNG